MTISATVMGRAGGNIVQVHHERLGSGHHAKNTTLGMLVEAQDEPHAQQIATDLRSEGFVVYRNPGAHLEVE